MVRLTSVFITLTCLLQVSSLSARVNTDWIRIGDPGNLEDTEPKRDGTRGYGAVDYTFRLGKFEVINSQYTEFLNAIASSDPNQLYDTDMGWREHSGIRRAGMDGSYEYSVRTNMGNKPVNYVSFFDAARYTNWLHNGQPVGVQDASTTEDGAYTFSDIEIVGQRNPHAQIFLPNEHEWQKAAFYEPGVITDNGDEYWTFPTRSDDLPQVATADVTGSIINPGQNIVNYSKGANWNGSSIGNVTTVGSAGSETYYGAADMGGNVFEWVEADPAKPDPLGAGPYIVRGSSFDSGGAHLKSNERNNSYILGTHKHNIPSRQVGFRIAATPSPYTADFDIDIDVDSDDLAAWIRTFGITDGFDIDTDDDDDIDGADFLAWQRQHEGDSPAEWQSVFGIKTVTNFDEDGDFDGADFLAWQQQSSDNSLLSEWQTVFGVTADADSDHDFDGADFLAWQRQHESDSPAVWQSFFGITAAANTDGDGDSDGNDFLAWQSQYTGNLGQQPVQTAVPEPSASVMLCVLYVMQLFVRQRIFQE